METSNAATTVGADVTIKGNLKSPSNILINGTVKGKVETKTDVNVGESALIEGSIVANGITISGTVQGNVKGRETIEMTPTGKIYGDVATSNLIIQSGATFVGKSLMSEKEGEEREEPDPEEEQDETEESEEEAEMKEKEAEEVLK